MFPTSQISRGKIVMFCDKLFFCNYMLEKIIIYYQFEFMLIANLLYFHISCVTLY